MPEHRREPGTSDHWLDWLCGAPARARSSPRVALVVAHPDDEVIGAGARLPQLRNVAVIGVTDGAPRDMHDARAKGFATRDEYAAARRSERAAALEIAGVDASCVFEIGLADQEASHDLAGLSLLLEALLLRLRPRVVLTHAYEGGHPDHDAVAFAVHAAVVRLRRAGNRAPAPPALFEFPSYHERNGRMVTGRFLQWPDSPERAVYLSRAERTLKRRMFECFVTQQRVLAEFATEVERFRAAPQYDFGAPPGAGAALYDAFPWGMRSGEWRDRARDAWRRLTVARVA